MGAQKDWARNRHGDEHRNEQSNMKGEHRNRTTTVSRCHGDSTGRGGDRRKNKTQVRLDQTGATRTTELEM